ncbi:MAG: YhcH/YjgK/YiaL family protein [Bacteroidota bacterium]
MILDVITHAERYLCLHPLFPAAFEFLMDVGDTAPGRYELEAPDLFAIITRAQGKPEAELPLEAHRAFIDIHLCIQGHERIGWRPLAACHAVRTPYDAEKDFMTFADTPSVWLPAVPGTFAIFFPEDAHAPMASPEMIHKAVVKVALRP